MVWTAPVIACQDILDPHVIKVNIIVYNVGRFEWQTLTEILIHVYYPLVDNQVGQFPNTANFNTCYMNLHLLGLPLKNLQYLLNYFYIQSVLMVFTDKTVWKPATVKMGSVILSLASATAQLDIWEWLATWVGGDELMLKYCDVTYFCSLCSPSLWSGLQWGVQLSNRKLPSHYRKLQLSDWIFWLKLRPQ